jgi:hypothetical protein
MAVDLVADGWARRSRSMTAAMSDVFIPMIGADLKPALYKITRNLVALSPLLTGLGFGLLGAGN